MGENNIKNNKIMIKKETRIILGKPLYIWRSDKNFLIRNKRTNTLYTIVSTGTDDDYEETNIEAVRPPIEELDNEHFNFE